MNIPLHKETNMKEIEQPNESQNSETTSFGLSADDLSMLNQVLQQVKGSSCVSNPVFEAIETE